jgi:hypothetical protein
MTDVKAPITKPAQAEDIYARGVDYQHYREDFQFLFGLGFFGIFAALGVLIALACVRSDQIRRLERLEKLNGIEQPQEHCGCCPLGDLATKGNRQWTN